MLQFSDTEIVWEKWLLHGGWPLKRWQINRGSTVIIMIKN